MLTARLAAFRKIVTSTTPHFAMQLDQCIREAQEYKKPDTKLAYGTAGFRCDADLLDSTLFRMGALAALRSMQRRGATGVMVTASHNPVNDNGIKLVDVDGGMLVQDWEEYATQLANAEGDAALQAALELVMKRERIEAGRAVVLVGRDTRPSSERLATAALRGARSLGAEAIDMGLLTTPQLHHIVRMRALGQEKWASEDGYYSMLADAFRALTADVGAGQLAARGPLVLDCADGVGAAKAERLQAALGSLLRLELRNTGAGELNEGAGAEFVQKQRALPRGVSPAADAGKRFASLDGDADRVVFFEAGAGGELTLLDGDKIAALAALFVNEQLAAAALDPPVSVGLVQTAYANGASTRFCREVARVPVGMAKTGVKFVHHAALAFDIGIYFEANGHGTVLFQPVVASRLRELSEDTEVAAERRKAASRLLAAEQLINQAVGDALSDLLLVEAVLALKGWTLREWDAMYEDLPSRQLKVKVADRTAITTIEDETRVTAPAALQEAVDALVRDVRFGRAFVRPSGTEDVVRVYAEAETQEAADDLALRVATAAFDIAGGVGPRPTLR